MSIAKRHKARIQLAGKSGVGVIGVKQVINAPDFSEKATSTLPEALQKLKDGFEGDRQSLKLLNGDQQRDPFKAELIEKYRPLCEYFMQNYDDWGRLDCLFWWLMWRSDIEAFANVEPDFYKAVQHGLTTPTKFERDWQTVYSDLVYLYCDANLKAGKEEYKEWDISCLQKLVVDISNGDIVINVPLKAKIYAVYGKVAMRLGQTENAAKAFKIALVLNDKVGVKKLLDECLLMLKPAEAESSEQGEVNE